MPELVDVVLVGVLAQQALVAGQAASLAWRDAGRMTRAAEATRSLKEFVMWIGALSFVNS